MIKKALLLAALAFGLAACSSSANKDANQADSENQPSLNEMETDTTSVKVEVKTTVGDFTVLLYGDTPIHRDNFLKLVTQNFYDSLLFHRVIDQFMVQGGDPDSKKARPGQMLGNGDLGYTLPAEIKYPKHFHKRGALAAARTGDNVNPERRSSGSQFYVVTGRTFTGDELKNMQLQMAFQQLADADMPRIRQMQQAGDRAGLQALQEELVQKAEAKVAAGEGPMTEEQVKVYSTVGGAPHLDGQYTVYGEVLSGMDTIEKIEKAKTDSQDRPKEDIRILSMKVVE